MKTGILIINAIFTRTGIIMETRIMETLIRSTATMYNIVTGFTQRDLIM